MPNQYSSSKIGRISEKEAPSRRINQIRGIQLAFVSLLLLGLLPIISNSRPVGLLAITFAFYLSLWQLISAVPLLIVEWKNSNLGIFGKQVSPRIKKKTLRIVVSTGIIFSISTYLYVLSFEKAGTVTAAIAIQTYPLFAIFIETMFLKKRKKIAELFFTMILMVGIYYLGTEGSWIIYDFSVWFILALAVPLLWSIAHVALKDTIDRTPITPNQIILIRVLISAFVLFIISSQIYGVRFVVGGLTNPEFQLFGFLMGIIYYLELIVWFSAVKHLDVSVASSITTPTPIITLILAFLVLQETVQSYELIAMLIVIISLYGLIYNGKEQGAKRTHLDV